MNHQHHDGHCNCHNQKCSCHAQPESTVNIDTAGACDCGGGQEHPPGDDPEDPAQRLSRTDDDLHQQHNAADKCDYAHHETGDMHHHEHDHDSCSASGHCSCCGDDCGCGHSHDEALTAPYSRPLTIIGGVLVAAAFLPTWGTMAPWLVGIGTLLIGYPLFVSGIRAIIKSKALDELSLMTIAVVASFGLAATSSDPMESLFEAFAVTALFRLGNYLEARAIAKSQRDIEALTNIRPDTALIISPDGQTRQIAAELVTVGSLIQLRAGDRVPIDCEIVSGAGYIDLSAITGEPIPIQGEPKTRLPSGAINLDGLLTCRTTTSFADSAASRIIRMVREAADKKGSAEKLISRFAKVYTPAVVVLAVLLATLPPLLGFGAFGMWLSRALVFLVASCPCALVISVPLTFFAGIGTASRAGILVKGSRYLETLAKTDCIAFDKTGTLTQGVPIVEEMKLVEGFDRETLLTFAAAAEQNSNHPAAKAVMAFAGKQPDFLVSDFTEHSGMGVSLMYDGKRILCGSFRLMAQNGVDYSPLEPANIYLAVDNRLACAFTLTDLPRKEVPQALEMLRDLGITDFAMLTGDAQNASAKIAASLGITNVFAQLLPEQKSERLATLRNTHRTTLFVGDGINDAPVLAGADVGIAMGLGTDTAIEAADVVLVNEQLTAIPRAIKIARKTVAKANQNIAFALTIKISVLLLGALGFATMWMAVFADVGVTILAVLNSLTLLSEK
ncbi:heavy metal translocating P-type ATPase [Oscillospiraceae bacterium LTW-04]|nr:heavy metal translocating P-type ATPase [Oscillospiraceae bacterium MB24-C1]